MFEMKDATDFPPLASVNVIQAVHDGVKIWAIYPVNGFLEVHGKDRG